MIFKIRRLFYKNRLTINLRSQRRSKMYPNTMKNDVYSSTKTSQNADGTKNCKTHFQRRSPTPPFWSQVRPGPRKSSRLWSRRWVSWALEQPKWSPRAPFPSSVAFVSPSSTLNFEISMHLSDFQDFRRSFWSILGLKIGPPMIFFRVLFEKIELFIYHHFFDTFSEQNTQNFGAR